MRATALAFAALFGLAAVPDASAEVRLTIQNGHVLLVARDATLRQILLEWAKVGQTKIVNAERVPGGPLTLQFINVPEESVLATLLRPLSGYIAAPRPSLVSNLSRYDRIVVMPIPAPLPAQSTSAGMPPQFQQSQPGMPTFGQPGPPTVIIPGVNDDSEDGPSAARPPVFNAFPQPQLNALPGMPSATPGVIVPPQGPLVLPQPNPPASQQPAYPGAMNPYGGVAVPGMLAAPLPGQPNAQQPKRPGGPGGSR